MFKIITILILMLIATYAKQYSFPDETCVVTILDVKHNMVFTENEIFENTINWQYFKFNEKDFQIGQKYKIRVVSQSDNHRNIISAEKL